MKTFFFFCFSLQSVLLTAQSWQDVGGGTNSSSHGMCIWNGKLVNAGSFNNPCNRVATWNDVAWECLGGGVGIVGRAAIEYNGNLVVVGDFWNNFQPCTDCNGIALWDGTSWQPLGTGFNNDVLCLAIWNGDLIAGGDFTEADGLPCSRIARWTGTGWVPIGGVNDFDNDIRCMIEFDGELWVGGDFNNVGGCTACDGLVKWNGTNWVGGDSGVDIQGGVDSTVRVLYVNQAGDRLYMGGHFIDLNIDGVVNTDFNGVAVYDGSAWAPLGTGVNSYVRALEEYNGNIIVGGDFTTAGSVTANKVAKWNPGTGAWSAMGTGMNDYVKSAAVYNGWLYVGGAFTTADGLPRAYIAKWFETPSTPPVAAIDNGSTDICAGSCINFGDNSSNSPTSWTWTFAGASVSSSTAQNPTGICYPSAGVYTVTLEACNSAGCNTTTQTITVNTSSSVSVNSTTICEGGSALLTATPSIPGGTYAWSPGGETSASITVGPAVTSTYSVVYTLNGCASAPQNAIVTVQPVPSVSVSGGSTICSGDMVTLTATPSTGGGTYSWAPGGMTTPDITVSPGSSETYSVTYTVNGCTSSAATATITVNPTPTLTVNDSNICEGSSALLEAIPSDAGGSFVWTPNGETSSSILVSPATTSSYSVIYTLNGCPSASYTGTVLVQEMPVVTVADISLCTGTPGNLVATPSIAGGTYSWSPGSGTTSAISVSPSSTTVYTVSYFLNGCTAADASATVTVLDSPSVTVSNEQTCAGETVLLTATPSTAGGTFSWLPGGETSAAISVNPVTSSSYTVTYTHNGCSGTATATVTVLPMPLTTVTSNAFVLTADQNGAMYQWFRCPAYVLVAGENSQSYSPDQDGGYAVEINLDGCVDTSECVSILGSGFTGPDHTGFSIYPNPANAELVISYPSALPVTEYRIYDGSGRVVLTGSLISTMQNIDLSNLSGGTYFFEVPGIGNGRLPFVKL